MRERSQLLTRELSSTLVNSPLPGRTFGLYSLPETVERARYGTHNASPIAGNKTLLRLVRYPTSRNRQSWGAY